MPDVEIPGRDQSIINKIRDKLASIDWAPGREPPKLTPDQWEFLWANITGPGFELPDEGPVLGQELPDVPDVEIPGRDQSIINKIKDKLTSIDWAPGREPPKLTPDQWEFLWANITGPGFELPDEGPVLGQELPDVPDVEIPGRDQSIINKIRDKLASIDWAPGREPPKLTPDQWEFLWANITGPGFELPDEGPVLGQELPDVPDSIPERPVSELDRDKIQNLIDYLQNRPGWEPLPPLLEANMDDLITLLQGYQRVETPNAEELLRRSKETAGDS